MIDNIKEKRIVAIIGDNRFDFCEELFIKYKINQFDYFSDDLVKDKINGKNINDLLKMVGLKEDILIRTMDSLSESEIIKVKFAYYLNQNSDYLVIDDIFDVLDARNCSKFFKILLKLKKYYNKTIFIMVSNINTVYEIIDDIIYVEKDNIIYDNKYDIYKNNNIKEIPDIIDFINKVKVKYPSVKYKDSINELIKELYRELR